MPFCVILYARLKKNARYPKNFLSYYIETLYADRDDKWMT